MNIKYINLLIFTIVLPLLLDSSVYAFLKSPVKKALTFMEADKYDAAIELLNQRINTHVEDAEAHFQLGICYMYKKMYDQAEDRFVCSINLDKTYGFKIGQEYKREAIGALYESQLHIVDILFQKAIEYDPRVKRHGYYIYKQLGDAAKEKDQLMYYRMAENFVKGNEELTENIGYSYLNGARATRSKHLSDQFKQHALRLLGKKTVYGYTISQQKNTWHIQFYTSLPVTILEKWDHGKRIFISGADSNETIYGNWPKSDELLPLPLNSFLPHTSDSPLILKYKNGGQIRLTFLDKEKLL